MSCDYLFHAVFGGFLYFSCRGIQSLHNRILVSTYRFFVTHRSRTIDAKLKKFTVPCTRHWKSCPLLAQCNGTLSRHLHINTQRKLVSLDIETDWRDIFILCIQPKNTKQRTLDWMTYEFCGNVVELRIQVNKQKRSLLLPPPLSTPLFEGDFNSSVISWH